jgi:hypothetical protein
MRGKWVAKAVLQKGISFLPDPQRANYLFQDRVTRSTILTDDVVQQRLGWAVMHLEAYDRNGGDRDAFTAVELGAGWYPIIPLALFLAGADEVHMVDLEDLTRPALVVQAIDHMVDLHGRGGLDALGTIDPARVDRLRSVRSAVLDDGHVVALQQLGLRITPMDARQLTLAQPPELIFSNTVFEHIPPDVLEGILARFGELAGPGTVMSHLIDHGDHYAYIDDTIDIHHFLRYSDRAWRIIDNDVQPMNRLRASQYVEMYRRLGLPLTEEHHRDCDPLTLVGIPLADRFRAMDPADVACAASHLVSRFD